MNTELRHFLKPGDYAIPVPTGVRITLQYNVSGNLEKVYRGYTDVREDITDKVISTFIKNKTVPQSIHIKGGTTSVKGVLYTSHVVYTSGSLPYCSELTLLSEYVDSPHMFNFFAHSVQSTATPFRGVMPARQFFQINLFKMLNGWIVPNTFDSSIVDEWIHDEDKYTFLPIVSDFVVYRGDTFRYMSNRCEQFIVKDVVRYVDANGYIKAKITKECGDVLYTDYSDVVHWNIHPKSLVVSASDKSFVYSKVHNSLHKQAIYSDSIRCSYCGKSLEVPDHGEMICNDVHCTSRLFSRVVQFMNVLHVEYDSDCIEQYIKSRSITCIPDIFTLDDYKDVHITTSLVDVMRSLIPTSYICTNEVLRLFSLACKSEKSTFLYYLNNPSSIASDLRIKHFDLEKLVSWLSDGYNVSDVSTLLDTEQLNISWDTKSYDVAPIFRGKQIYLTGDFIRGSALKISEILVSYAADVVPKFCETVNCVLVGSTHDNADGKSIASARRLGIPVFDENDFFLEYGIDDDIK